MDDPLILPGDLAPASRLYLATPGPEAAFFAYGIIAGGETSVSAGDGLVTRAYHHHTLILTLSGEGVIETGRALAPAIPGSLAWLDTSRAYAHGARHGSKPWNYLWLGFTGAGLDALHAHLGLSAHPVFRDCADLAPDLARGVALLEARPANFAAEASALIARLLAALWQRGALRLDAPADPVEAVIRALRATPEQGWSVETMARAARLSQAQFFRRFRAVTGTTPTEWLKRERMALARHQLAAGKDKVAVIAARCGYPDPYHFSRDFRRLNGLSPRAFREQARRG